MSWQFTFSLIYYIGRFESIFLKDTIIWRLKKFFHQKIIQKGASFSFLFIQQTFEDFCADFCEDFSKIFVLDRRGLITEADADLKEFLLKTYLKGEIQIWVEIIDY